MSNSPVSRVNLICSLILNSYLCSPNSNARPKTFNAGKHSIACSRGHRMADGWKKSIKINHSLFRLQTNHTNAKMETRRYLHTTLPSFMPFPRMTQHMAKALRNGPMWLLRNRILLDIINRKSHTIWGSIICLCLVLWSGRLR